MVILCYGSSRKQITPPIATVDHVVGYADLELSYIILIFTVALNLL